MREGHVIEPPTPPARAVRRRAVPPPVATWLALVAFLLIAAVLAYRTAHKLAPTAHPEILAKAGIVLTPGSGFGAAGEGYVRAAFTVNVDRIREAVERIKKLGIRGA